MECIRKRVCSWCGQEIEGKPLGPFGQSELEFGPELPEENEPEFKEYYFCSEGCSWGFQAENERLYGASERQVRRHLTEVHGLVYVAVSRLQSVECRSHFEARARVLNDWMMRQRIVRRFELGA